VAASAPGRRPVLVFLIAAAVSLAVDQLTKAAVLVSPGPGLPMPLIGHWVRIVVTHNTASAFGLVRSPAALLAATALVSLAIAAYALGGRLLRRPQLALPLGLVLGGSLGNLLDRVRTQGVTDFIDLRVWPVFNVADIAITAGVVLLAIQMGRQARPARERRGAPPS